MAAWDSGTRCSTPDFIRSAGMRYSRASRSISAQVAPRVSPDLAAVRTVNHKQSLAVDDARAGLE